MGLLVLSLLLLPAVGLLVLSLLLLPAAVLLVRRDRRGQYLGVEGTPLG